MLKNANGIVVATMMNMGRKEAMLMRGELLTHILLIYE
jgi:hypothetical protein